RAAAQHHPPRALLIRAWQRSLNGALTGAESAQRDLDEAWEIAERGPMPLYLADIHLYRARLFGNVKSQASGETYPRKSATAHLDAALRRIESHSSHRRSREH